MDALAFRGYVLPGFFSVLVSDFCLLPFQAASPACSELETVCLDWLARAFNLPKHFIFSEPESQGGGKLKFYLKNLFLNQKWLGVLETSASEAILVSMLAARSQAIKHIRGTSGSSEDHDSVFLPKLVAYCSKEAHSSVEKAAMIALVQLRVLETDGNCSLRGTMLQKVSANG